MALKALILTCGGTLAQTADVRRSAFNQAFSEAGLDWIWGRVLFAQILSSARSGDEVAFFAKFRHPDIAPKMENSGLWARLAARQNSIYLNMLEAGSAPLRPGIARLMSEAVASSVKLFICSTGDREEFETLLFNQFGPEMIDAISGTIFARTSGIDTQEVMLRRAGRTLGIPPQNTLLICSQPQESEAAARLGMTAIATPTAYTRRQNFTGAHLVLSDLGRPTEPFSVLSGEAITNTYTSLSHLHTWHEKCQKMSILAA